MWWCSSLLDDVDSKRAGGMTIVHPKVRMTDTKLSKSKISDMTEYDQEFEKDKRKCREMNCRPPTVAKEGGSGAVKRYRECLFSSVAVGLDDI